MATPTADRAPDRAPDHAPDHALDVLAQAQEAGLRLAGTVAESWTAVLRGVPGVGSPFGADTSAGTFPNTGVPHTAAEAVDRFYDTAVQILEAQRSVAHHVLGAVAPALRPLTLATQAAERR